MDLSKLKTFANDEYNVTQKLKFALGRVENIEEKGENAGYQHFLLIPQCFQNAFKAVKSRDCMDKGEILPYQR